MTQAYWNLSGSSLFPNSLGYNVSIGKNVALYPLEVQGVAVSTVIAGFRSSAGSLLFDISDDTGDGYIRVRDSTATAKVLLRSEGASYFGGGKVGIGTEVPSALLHVNGTGALLNVTSGSTAVLFANGSSVGIGTASPGYLLDVAGRVRVRGSGNSAGVWLSESGTPTTDASFVGRGSETADFTGFYPPSFSILII